jgi:MarR family transcriptional regulator, transcriptional regulator for hemolysin
LEYDFHQSVGYWLTLTTQAYHRAVCDELAPHGITYRQLQVICWLKTEGDLSQTELAAKMLVEPPTLVGILDRMERDGWITRHNCPSDRRKKLIRVNSAVEPVWDTIMSYAARVRARATEGLSEEQKEILMGFLQHIQSNLEVRNSVETVA